MATPALFPDLDPSQFIESAAVAAVATTVLERDGAAGEVGRLFNVARAISGEEIRVLFMVNAKPFDPLKDDVKHDAIAKCIKAPTLWHDVTGYDAVIWCRGWFWDQFLDDQREALLLHELLHLEVEYDDDGEVQLRVRKHDLEEFTDVALRFGGALPGIDPFVRAFGQWQHGREHPEPTSLRPVEDIAGRVMDAVADAAERGELDDPERGVTVTVERSAKGRPEDCPFHGCVLAADHPGDHAFNEAGGA